MSRGHRGKTYVPVRKHALAGGMFVLSRGVIMQFHLMSLTFLSFRKEKGV